MKSIVWLALALPACAGVEGLLRPEAHQQQHAVDFQAAHAHAVHAATAYQAPEAIRERFAGRQVVVQDLPTSDVRFYVLREPARQVVAIRGTEESSVQNWAVNAVVDVERDPTLGITTHEGWGYAAQELLAAVRPRLEPGRPVLVVGHSLGGALAVLVGLHLQREGYAVCVVTFGQPKVTNLESALALEHLDVTRFVTDEDPVVSFPPPHSDDVDRLYSHFGSEVLLLGDGSYRFSEAHQVLATSSLDVLYRPMTAYAFDEHRIATYVELLAAMQAAAREVPP